MQCWHLPLSHSGLLVSPHQGKICFANCLELTLNKQPKERPFSSKVAEHASHVGLFFFCNL